MSNAEIFSRIIHAHDTEFNWNNTSFTPRQGEIIVYDVDTNHNYERFKIGDGKTSLKNLPFIIDATVQDFLEYQMNYDLNVKSINHRGYNSKENSDGAPENTIPAYILSKQKGFTYVEADVSFTSDGVAVLLHNTTIDGTSNGTGEISKMTYEYVLQYDFGSWVNSNYTGVKIPTFTEFIICCKRLGLHPYIELKAYAPLTRAQAAEKVVKEVELCGMKGKVTYISFDNEFLTAIKNIDPNARLGLLANPLNSSKISQAVALKTGSNEVFLDAKLSTVNKSLIDSCIAKKLPLEVWTVNAANEIKEMPSYITGVTSDKLIAGKILYNEGLFYIPPESTYVPTTGISLNEMFIIFNQSYEEYQLTTTVEPENSSESVKWISSDETIATVDQSGLVHPVSNGECEIIATSGSCSASCVVNVDITYHHILWELNNCTTTGNSHTIITIENGDNISDQIIPLGGYKLAAEDIVITMSGIHIEEDSIVEFADSSVSLSITNITGDVIIRANAHEVPSYSITRNLIGCYSHNQNNKIEYNGEYRDTIDLLEDYTFNDADINITMGDQVLDGAYWMVLDNHHILIEIPEVTGNIVINITAKEIFYMNIVRELVGCVSDNPNTRIAEGETLRETITPLPGYELGNNYTISVGDLEIPDAYDNGVITYEVPFTDKPFLQNFYITVIAEESTQPIIDLDCCSFIDDSVIVNNGTGGTKYDATIITQQNGDYYDRTSQGVILHRHAYANMSYGFKSK